MQIFLTSRADYVHYFNKKRITKGKKIRISIFGVYFSCHTNYSNLFSFEMIRMWNVSTNDVWIVVSSKSIEGTFVWNFALHIDFLRRNNYDAMVFVVSLCEPINKCIFVVLSYLFELYSHVRVCVCVFVAT